MIVPAFNRSRKKEIRRGRTLKGIQPRRLTRQRAYQQCWAALYRVNEQHEFHGAHTLSITVPSSFGSIQLGAGKAREYFHLAEIVLPNSWKASAENALAEIVDDVKIRLANFLDGVLANQEATEQVAFQYAEYPDIS